MRNPEKETDYLKLVDRVIEEGPYRADWESLCESGMPQWFSREKLGIFLHWGLYSVPANSNEWYSRNMYIKGMPAYEHHQKKYGQQKDFGYKDFIPMLTAEKFDPAEWIRMFKAAGAGYVFPVAEHHDGFQMYESELSDWNAVDMGPHRDVLGELKKEAEAQGLVFCTSSHRAEHWFFMSHGKEFDSDIKEPLKKGDFYWPAMPEPDAEDLFSHPYPTTEYLDDWLARTAEIIVKYQPKLLYFDWWIQHEAFKPYLKKLAAFYYNCGKKWGTDVKICYKHDAMMFGSGIVEVERGGFAEAKPYPWQTDTAVARNSWCYTDTLDYKSSNEIICTLIDVVSKNGNLLLNVGPKADGTIPEGDQKILRDLAKWMEVNREAIVGAKVWRKSMEGPVRNKEGQFQDQKELAYTSADYRFTTNRGNIYACCMKCPEDGKFLVTSLRDSKDQNVPEFHGVIRKVRILGFGGKIVWHTDKRGLHVEAEGLESEFPVVIQITTA
jgi:alpha-L-fucosidase